MNNTAPTAGIGGTTDEAFKLLVNDPQLWKQAGGNSNLRRQLLSMLNNDKGISLDLKEKWLRAAGFKVVQEATWNVPPLPDNWKKLLKAKQTKKTPPENTHHY